MRKKGKMEGNMDKLLILLFLLSATIAAGCSTEKSEAVQGEYTDFTLTIHNWKENAPFSPKTVFTQIGGNGTNEGWFSLYAFGEPSNASSLEEIMLEIGQIEKSKIAPIDFKGAVMIASRIPTKLPAKVTCDLEEEDPECGIVASIASLYLSESYEMDIGKATFYFNENGFVEGEIDAAITIYFNASLKGKFKVKIKQKQ